eukprot:scaffold7970_cov147-Skeletonema_marinoi.AAC.5
MEREVTLTMTEHPPRSSTSRSSRRQKPIGLVTVTAFFVFTVYAINLFYMHVHVANLNLHNLDSDVFAPSQRLPPTHSGQSVKDRRFFNDRDVSNSGEEGGSSVC